MGFESFNMNKIESGNKPEKLYRGFTVNPEALSLQMLKQELVPGTVNEDDPTKIGDGNEIGVYMSTNSTMVESAYTHSRVSITVPRYNDRGGITNFITLPACGIVVEVDTSNLAVRPPKITKTLQGVYNNGFQGDEWIADTVPKEAYRVTKLMLSAHANDVNKVVLDINGFNDEQMLEAINTIKNEFSNRKQEALKFKTFLESLPERERLNEFFLKRKYEKYKQNNTITEVDTKRNDSENKKPQQKRL